jgi:hypothetical protein
MNEESKCKQAADCWKRGAETMLKQNWDRAIGLFRQATELCPDNLMFRQSLRGCEERKYNNNGTGSAAGGMELTTLRRRIETLRHQKNWTDLAQVAEDGLAFNPWDLQFNIDLGDALREQGLTEIAIWSYQRAVQRDENNKDIWCVLGELFKSLGERHESSGNLMNAADCFERALQLDPLDGATRDKLISLEATVRLAEEIWKSQIARPNGFLRMIRTMCRIPQPKITGIEAVEIIRRVMADNGARLLYQEVYVLECLREYEVQPYGSSIDGSWARVDNQTGEVIRGWPPELFLTT